MVEAGTTYPISPDEYRLITSGIQTAWRIAGCREGIWPKDIPVKYQELVAKTTPLERAIGLKMGQWPFSLEDIRDRSPNAMRERRLKTARMKVPPDRTAWRFNLEEMLSSA